MTKSLVGLTMRERCTLLTYLRVILLVLSISMPAQGLDLLGRTEAQGGQGVTRGLVALYHFSATQNGQALANNLVVDESGVGVPLNLQISDTMAIQRRCDQTVFDPLTNTQQQVCFLDFVEGSRNAVKSLTAAAKITNQCRASNELTVEMWLRNDRADELTKEGRMMPLKIVTLGRNTGAEVNNRYIGSSNDANFFLGLDYNMAPQFTAAVRQGARTQRNADVNDGFTSNNNTFNMQQAARYAIETSHRRVNTPDSPENTILVNNKLQHVVYTYTSSGQGKLYVSGAAEGDGEFENPFGLIPVVRAQETTPNVTAPFAGWGSDFFLGIGNENTYAENEAPVVRTGGNITFRTENREWRGQLYTLAIYCNAHTDTEILGDAAPGNRIKVYPPNPAVQVNENHIKAAKLYTRMVGVKIPVTAPIISGVNDIRVPDEDYAGAGMVQLIAAGDLAGAARLATEHDGFYNTTMKDFAKRMSTRDETVNTVLNDFVATIIGVARDDVSAKELLTGNFFYMGAPGQTAAPSNMLTDLLMSNNHYERLEGLDYNLRSTLVRVDGQKASTGTTVVDHPDPAGILTSRAFLSAHAVAGTNRRIIEYAFREFMCVPIAGWADSTGPDNMIGQDVDRYPGGDHQKFLTGCRGCHSNMDGLRGAFAKVHFNNNFVKHANVVTSVVATEDDETATTMCQRPQGVACKMNRNDDEFPEGFVNVNDSWVNNAYRGGNQSYFGWNQAISGRGMKAFGEMISNSPAFPNCMAKRAFRSVCKRDAGPLDQNAITQASQAFVNSNYNLRTLFSNVAVSTECGGL